MNAELQEITAACKVRCAEINDQYRARLIRLDERLRLLADAHEFYSGKVKRLHREVGRWAPYEDTAEHRLAESMIRTAFGRVQKIVEAASVS